MLELWKALILIVEFCTEQDSCESCPIRSMCGKIPSEW
jgi:hypothetical protein